MHVHECAAVRAAEEDGRLETSGPHLHLTALLSYRRSRDTVLQRRSLPVA